MRLSLSYDLRFSGSTRLFSSGESRGEVGESQEQIRKIKSKVTNVSKSRFVQHSPIEATRSRHQLNASWCFQDRPWTSYFEEKLQQEVQLVDAERGKEKDQKFCDDEFADQSNALSFLTDPFNLNTLALAEEEDPILYPQWNPAEKKAVARDYNLEKIFPSRVPNERYGYCSSPKLAESQSSKISLQNDSSAGWASETGALQKHSGSAWNSQ